MFKLHVNTNNIFRITTSSSLFKLLGPCIKKNQNIWIPGYHLVLIDLNFIEKYV